MSYDLNVYGTASLSSDELVLMLETTDGLEAVNEALTSDYLAVRDHRSRIQVFTVDGPFDLEPEDLRDEPSSVAGATVLYSIAVLTSDEQDLARAKLFAELLASRIRGSVVDLQSHQALISRADDARPASGAKRYLHAAWFRLRDGSASLAEIYLEAARSAFPQAVPTRYGTHEPLQGRLPRDGDTSFGALYRHECALSDLMLVGKFIVKGRITGWSNDFTARYHSIRVTFDFDAIEAAGALERFEDFFVAVGRQSSSFFGFAELNVSRSRTAASPHFGGAWGGLPRAAQWATWYSREYAELVRPYLSSGEMRDYPEGAFHRWTSRTVSSNELRPLLTRAPWAHPDLLSVRDPSSGDVLEPAKSMPASLRYPAPGSREAMRIEANIARNLETMKRK